MIGVANESKTDAWIEAIETDGIGIWYHVLQGFDFSKYLRGQPNDWDIGEKFRIEAYPAKILIDKTGVIIGRYFGIDDGTLERDFKKIFE